MPTLPLADYTLSLSLPPSRATRKDPWVCLPSEGSLPHPLDNATPHEDLVHLSISCLPDSDCAKGHLESYHTIYHPSSCEAFQSPSPIPSACASPTLRPQIALSPKPAAVVNSPGSVMPKKRRSLQSILVPQFFHPALSSDVVPSPPPPSPGQRYRSHSAAASTSNLVLPPAIPIAPTPAIATPLRNSPPSDLLDDDPFADLSLAPAERYSVDLVSSSRPVSQELGLNTNVEQPQRVPRSPLAVGFADASNGPDADAASIPPWARAPTTPPSTPVLTSRSLMPPLRRPKSTSDSPRGQVRPAYTRPAFSARPSLPSLHTLAQMNIPVKVKRGRVGATLPAEPWSLPDPQPHDSEVSMYDQSSLRRPSHSRRPTLSTIRDSRIITGESLYASPIDIQASDFYDNAPETPMDSSHTPRASGSNSLFNIDMSSLDQQSKIYVSASPDGTLPSSSTSDDTHSSPDSSFPSTPQLAADMSTYYNQGYSSLFAHNSSTSFFDDLAATLDDDYSHGNPGPHNSGTLNSEDELGCDFEPGSSAQTLRSFMPAPSTTHFRSSSSTSDGDTIHWTSSLGNLPLSPTMLSTASDDSIPTSSSSSDLGDGADFLSFDSDSSEDEAEYLTAPLSSSGSLHSSPPRVTAPLPTPTLAYDDEPDYLTVSESSGKDITARLSSLSIPDRSDAGSSQYVSADEYMDAGDGAQRSNGSYSRQEGSSRQESSGRWQTYNGGGNGRATGGGNGFTGGSGGGRDDRDGNDDRHRRPYPRAGIPTRHNSSDTSESEEESSDDYGDEERPKPSQPSKATRPPSPSSTDDDVPLAQAIPGALKAQRTIRRQVRDEKEQKKRARSIRRPQAVEQLPAPPTLPKAPTSFAEVPVAGPSKSLPGLPSQPLTRPRTRTLPSQPASPFSVGELTKKLLGVQVNGGLAPPPLPLSPARRSHDLPPRSPVSPDSRFPPESLNVPARTPSQDASASRVRPMRSFHRPRTTAEESGAAAPPVPSLGRSATTASRRPPVHDSQPPPSAIHPSFVREEGQGSLERARSTKSTKSSHSRRPSQDRSGRPSVDRDRPPLPPLPSGEVLTTMSLKPQTAWQQRLFIGNLQRFCQVEITSTSSARDVLETLQNQGALDEGTAQGWMLWEVSQDFGMERPIRSFEIVADVTGSWLADKTVNVLMAKRTPLSSVLSRAAIPSSSPMYGAYVQWEYKRGKWQKRWLELREHSLWLSKRDTGKDHVQLCSLNNFDAYIVTRIGKAPKPFVFAVKSTDNLSYFESTADYVHTFSCETRDGENFVEKILLARSYVLHQERNVLSSGAAIGGGASLSRAGTRRQRPAQPLVNFGAQAVAASEPPPPVPPVNFEPGSLLAKRS